MAYLGGSGFEEADAAQAEYESQTLATAFQQFSSGNFEAAAATLGPAGLVASGLVTTGVGAVLGVALAVGLALTKLIGRGRNEADIITPIQNQLVNPQGTGQLDQITQAFVRNPTIQGLQALYDQVQRIGAAWLEFLSDPAFTDGRASQQAANTIMPYLNGSCGYHWPPPLTPTQANCIQWGDGTPGGVGTNGMLGALSRAIVRLGGTVPPPLLTQGYGSSIATLGPSGSQNFPFLPQAGTIPANAPLSPLRPSSVPVISAGIGLDLSTVLIVGAGLYLLQKRRG